ncbi:maleylpyruvate isomerase family mycothiol-dependent enzyme [Kribbella sp. NPDC051770]|uniref:maleylpyruvate isomerase family mycothiol-dependent enzyme n=1 Tax=Kribbella sp. NPDC051770 TaxID=3155413 RepID=UPI00342DDEEE
MGELHELIRTERLGLIELLETLGPAEWSTPSLCGAWTVQEVAAHLAWAPVTPMAATLVALVRSGFRLNRASAEQSRTAAEAGPEAILAQLRDNARTGALPSGVPVPAGVVEAVVHGIDIRRPLGRPVTITPEVFRIAADTSVGLRWPLTVVVGGSARKRLAGLTLVAEGYDWSYGEGPEAVGSAETVLRVLNGRPVDRAELTGPGAGLLMSRL